MRELAESTSGHVVSMLLAVEDIVTQFNKQCNCSKCTFDTKESSQSKMASGGNDGGGADVGDDDLDNGSSSLTTPDGESSKTPAKKRNAEQVAKLVSPDKKDKRETKQSTLFVASSRC